ncbi:MAG: riboflavin synthase subunit beta [Tenacibaculum sp.]
MGIIKIKNKKFSYQPRYYKGKGNPYEFKYKFDKYRITAGKKKSLKAKFTAAFDEFKNSKYGGFNKTLIIIIAVLIFIFLYLIDFDLSIFFTDN